MSNRASLRITASAALAVAALTATVAAQTNPPATTATATAGAAQTPPERAQRRPTPRRLPEPPARVTVVPNQTQTAPQVVTIVHRLTGVKVLRLLQRQVGANAAIENVDPESLKTDAHASILAGWALDDGKTVAARLPQAFAEIEIPWTAEVRAQWQAQTNARAGTFAPFMLQSPRIEPDLTVITGDGKKLRAHLVGLDGETGLSILQVIGGIPPLPPPKSSELTPGQAVQIFAPEQAESDTESVPRTVYVKVGKFDATVAKVTGNNSELSDTLILRGGKLSPEVVGGIACDQFGNTLGIVDSIDGDNASVVSAAAVQAATKRVLARQASVPRPWLGASGESLEVAGRAGLLASGWREDQANQLMSSPSGILLTIVTPKAPAALAQLHPGDVIVRVNQDEVKNADVFSTLLDKAGSGEQVMFTLKRPDVSAPLEIPVKLGSSFAPGFEWTLGFADPSPTQFWGWQQLGIQMMALTAKAASGFGAQNGFIVVAVKPLSAAARGGIREGDVIESIDGRIVGRGAWTNAFTAQKKHTVSIVRDREKKQIVLEVEE